MTNIFRSSLVRCLVILLITFIVLTLTVEKSKRRALTWPEKVVKNQFAMISKFMYRPVAWWQEEPLQAEKGERFGTEDRLRMLEEENHRLREILKFTKRNSVKYIVAEVVARSPDRWNNQLVIDQGSANGVRTDMSVITEEGLIGRIHRVSGRMADVELLTDNVNGSGVGVYIQSDREVFGTVEGFDNKKQRLLIKKISIKATIKPGQRVVTTGLSKIYPGNLLVGTVGSVIPDNLGMEQIVYVKPAANFERITKVIVLRDPLKMNLIEHWKKRKTIRNGEE